MAANYAKFNPQENLKGEMSRKKDNVAECSPISTEIDKKGQIIPRPFPFGLARALAWRVSGVWWGSTNRYAETLYTKIRNIPRATMKVKFK